MQTVIDKLSDIFSAGFSAAGYDAALGRVVVSARPDLCQFQCNGAMSAAKQYRKAPLAIADKKWYRVMFDSGEMAFIEADKLAKGIGNEIPLWSKIYKE